jgi:hypothetical protein
MPSFRSLIEIEIIGANAKFRSPSCLLSGRKVRTSDEEEEEEK